MIYLASTSPRRRSLLRREGVRFKTLRPGYEEGGEAKGPPAALVKKHALGKAVSVAGRLKNGAVLAADTVVVFGGKIIGKPKSKKDAVRLLGRIQGKWHTVYTGVAWLEVRGGAVNKKRVFSETTRVRLKPLDRGAVARVFRSVDPMDKAGAYAIQCREPDIVAEVRGSWTSAAGLPIDALKRRRLI
ncbi:MAG: septum formation protein Maf [Candidatus Omnitrophica bacterium]|nr:septum formation protein Maf [Candidatus Omnitrophota bacterium]